MTVLDWQRDFRHGHSILDEIEDAAARTSAGIFLFTKEDALSSGLPGAASAPRDNVVFEAGYFAAAKGKSQVLIIREDGAKMPADLGGDIYAVLKNRSNLRALTREIQRFIDAI